MIFVSSPHCPIAKLMPPTLSLCDDRTSLSVPIPILIRIRKAAHGNKLQISIAYHIEDDFLLSQSP